MEVITICFGQFGPYHHARVSALQQAAAEQGVRVVSVQIAGATTTYEWTEGDESRATGNRCDELKTLCEGVEEAASPLEVFLSARKLFREEKVEVAFLPSYSPARYFALFAAAKSLGIRTVMMNESHAGTEQASGWKRWIKRQIVKQFDAALVGGEPHKRHFASLGIPADKIFTGYDAVDNALFAAKADEVRKKSDEWRVTSDELGEQDESSKDQETKRQTEAEHLSTLISQPSTGQSVRSAYGLPQRYFLSLGRMVEKKNLATLVAAYGRYCDEWRVTSDESPRHAPASLVFVGSGELEGALREQALSLGLRVVERTDWKAGQSSHRLTRIDAAESARQPEANKSERLAADRTEGNADCRMTSTAGGLSPETTDGEDAAATKTRHSLPATRDEENCGTVFFYGFRQIEENPVFYALAEAFVLPSLKEEWGLVVNEAMAAGLPVIVSRAAGCAEDLVPKAPASRSSQLAVGSIQSRENADADDSLEERSNGFVFDPKSIDALSEALRRIAVAGEELKVKGNDLEEMGQRSREIVAKFSCENFAQQALRAAEAVGTALR